MEMTNEQQRIEFSQRLIQELKRIGQPLNSPTQIARSFNQHFIGQPVSPQTIRKWLLAEAVPTQPKLLALAEWLGVSAQWLRYGTEEVRQASLVEYAGLLERLANLSPSNLRLIDGIVQLMSSEK